jgi:hypothetical protein
MGGIAVERFANGNEGTHNLRAKLLSSVFICGIHAREPGPKGLPVYTVRMATTWLVLDVVPASRLQDHCEKAGKRCDQSQKRCF